MPRVKRVSSIHAQAWLNAFAENDSCDESASENVCEGLHSGSANSDQVRLTWEVIPSYGSDSKIDIHDLEQTYSASCQLSALAVAAMIQVMQFQRRVMGVLQTTRKLDWLLRTEQNVRTSKFFQNRGVATSLARVNTKRSLTRCAHRMLDDPLSAFELLVDNSMLTHVQQCTEAKAYRGKNSDK